jgi:nicotinamide riboside kinase
MKIAFIGSHGVGKTTLCYELAALIKKHGGHVDIVKEVARQSPLPINRQTSLEAQLWILTTQIAEEIRSASQHTWVVCDRSVVDNYAYLALACGRQPFVEPFVDHWMGTYDLLVKVPVGAGELQADGIRDVDIAFVRAIDTLVDRLLEEKGLRCERLDRQARAGWVDRVAARLRERGALPESFRP